MHHMTLQLGPRDGHTVVSTDGIIEVAHSYEKTLPKERLHDLEFIVRLPHKITIKWSTGMVIEIVESGLIPERFKYIEEQIHDWMCRNNGTHFDPSDPPRNL